MSALPLLCADWSETTHRCSGGPSGCQSPMLGRRRYSPEQLHRFLHHRKSLGLQFNGLLPHSAIVGGHHQYKERPHVVEIIPSGQDEKEILYASDYASKDPITIMDHP